MAKDDNVKRIGLYFNLEDAEEKEMYNYINARKKSRYLKTLVLNDIKASKGLQNIQPIQTQPIEEEDNLNDCDLNASEMDFD